MSSLLVELEFEDVEFLVGGKPENPEKNSQRKAKINNKINPITWEASALTTAQSLLHKRSCLAMIIVITITSNDYTYILG